MAPAGPRNSFAPNMPSQRKKGNGHLLSGTNGLRKTIDGTTLADAVMATSQRPKINYDKMKVKGEVNTPPLLNVDIASS